ncbi:uncharacterized protein N7479_009077 [Penicillium vulpinum]|uniref:Uncharacterized protein n=1 Tax=Penicillium vulpinum TaxID=29845 RepID=A0A1V6RT90_9EURO|nr:uncharacterized protein N7479_009077 [Penicillium vulpinum]KAJ5950664.1 hypothetical protein N7479_009077 [Penicillium vulpinum]OQE04992.1 hypothetical protein PENVUL_c028G03420 [Penicillium vulpinum]
MTDHWEDFEETEGAAFDDEDDIENGQTSSFGIHLEEEGGESGYHTRNPLENPEQRSTLTSYEGSVDVRGNALETIHGQLGADSTKFASLVVYEFRFTGIKWKSRIRQVRISVKFRSSTLGARGPRIHSFSPHGTYGLLPVDQDYSDSRESEVNAQVGQTCTNLGGSLKWTTAKSYTSTNYTQIKGVFRTDEYGYDYGVTWILNENPTTKTGVPTWFRAAIILEREDEDKFEADVEVATEVDNRTWKERLRGVKDPTNEPVLYNPQIKPTNKLRPGYDISQLGDIKPVEFFDASLQTVLGDTGKKS